MSGTGVKFKPAGVVYQGKYYTPEKWYDYVMSLGHGEYIAVDPDDLEPVAEIETDEAE